VERGETREAYQGCQCIYCGYRPGIEGRLSLLIINGELAWSCLGCEAQTIPSQGVNHEST
jgi:hypothetical protein